jgi:hypothetical protein
VVFVAAGFFSAESVVELWRAPEADTHAKMAIAPTAMHRTPRIRAQVLNLKSSVENTTRQQKQKLNETLALQSSTIGRHRASSR